jgi:hypothetical protein
VSIAIGTNLPLTELPGQYFRMRRSVHSPRTCAEALHSAIEVNGIVQVDLGFSTDVLCTGRMPSDYFSPVNMSSDRAVNPIRLETDSNSICHKTLSPC